jgi:hypothetical protein
MGTIIHSNGSKWIGQQPDSIEQLIDVLGKHTLDRTFEAYGDFTQRGARNGRGEPVDGINQAVCFFGNFIDLSHVFRITTDEQDVIERLSAAIADNKKRPEYLRQPPPYVHGLLHIERKRFSETQGEVLLTYDGERIEQFGDDIQLTPHGWRGRPDEHWHKAAAAWLARRHREQFEREQAA